MKIQGAPDKIDQKIMKIISFFQNRIFRAHSSVLGIRSCSMKRKLEIPVYVNPHTGFFFTFVSEFLANSQFESLFQPNPWLAGIKMGSDPGFSEIRPTLRSSISELSEYFYKISTFLERSMSKLSYEPNTIKNGHLA